MNDGKTFKEAVREEIEKLKKMTFHEKRQHIWEYYKIHMLLVVTVIFFIFGMTQVALNPPKREFVYIAWLGPTIETSTLNALGESLSPLLENPQRQRISVTSYTETSDETVNQAMRQRFVMLLHTASMDLIITTRIGMEELHEMEWLRPLEGVFARMPCGGENLTKVEFDGRPKGISLAQSNMFNELGFETDNLYIMAVMNTNKLAQIALVLEEIFR